MNLFLAILSGVITIFIFPYSKNPHVPYLGWMAWFSFVPLCYALISAPPKKAFFLGFVTAFIYYGGSIWWIYAAIHNFASYPAWVAVALILACVSALAGYAGGACLAARFLSERFRISLVMTLPVCWTFADYIRTYVPFGGFPWNNVAYSQHMLLPVIQIADITGIYGITFTIILVNISVAAFIRWCKEIRMGPIDRWIFLAPITVSIIIGYGFYRLYTFPPAGKNPLNVAIIHGATPQERRNAGAEDRRQVAVFSDLSAQAVKAGADLIIWPETIFIGHAPVGYALPVPISNHGISLILGAETSQPDFRLANSAVLVGPDGLVKGVHSKVHLVPVGEYIPKGFFFIREPAGSKQRLIPGRDYNLFDIEGAKAGVLICYEDVFPVIARRFVKRGASFLTVISNDGWFEGTSAALQHLTFSVFRAVENRRYIARSSNRGASAFISPIGRKMDSETATVEVSLMNAIYPTESKTVYTICGDWFVYFLAVVMIAAILRRSLSKRKALWT